MPVLRLHTLGVSLLEVMMYLEYHGRTDPGKVRDINEDKFWYRAQSAMDTDPEGLFIVCDGMGGHLSGELASKVAIDTIKANLSDLFCDTSSGATVILSDADIEAAVTGSQSTIRLPDAGISDRIITSVLLANQAIRQLSKARPKEAGDAGTTLTMAYITGNHVVIANIGDSRTYLIHDHQLQQITRDHSLVGGLLAQGMITEEEIYTHPDRNIIFRSLGQSEDAAPDLFQLDLADGDILVLCSDGLWEMLPDKGSIVGMVESAENLEAATQRLVDAANNAGGSDNISVILVRFNS